ncbi:hypothetical protein AVEN_11181-1 [Araneus ventricosus]|uniref:Uncharacterized protein n=1 Tax=Araneus ventricosus TaxID=182803 RepID=A0A4Y2TB94_ARAVE|nr:hypothetical protein AVEN_11181-1 [Araneus ventricosus]
MVVDQISDLESKSEGSLSSRSNHFTEHNVDNEELRHFSQQETSGAGSEAIPMANSGHGCTQPKPHTLPGGQVPDDRGPPDDHWRLLSPPD